jgi:hypothetical protein
MKPFPLDENYLITEDGRIWSKHIESFISTNRKTYTPNNQYKKWYCAGTKKDYLVHRTVFLTFGNMSIEEFTDKITIVNHKDSNKLNNHISNLEKTTFKGNLLHYHNRKYTVPYLIKYATLSDLQQAVKEMSK